MKEFFAGQFDIAVIGAGHAGIEAALAAARMGLETVCLTMNLDAVGNMPCNPAIGGTGKGHLVRELDALGGEMARGADAACIQYRMLNRGKGPAVHSLRAQADRRKYQQVMKHTLERQEHLTLRQGEVVALRTEDGSVRQVVLRTGAVYGVRAVILCSGTYLHGRTIVGECVGVPPGRMACTPPESWRTVWRPWDFPCGASRPGRPHGSTPERVDFDRMEVQTGDDVPVPFSFSTTRPPENRAVCWLTYTNEETHRIIRENLDRSPHLYRGHRGGGAAVLPLHRDEDRPLSRTSPGTSCLWSPWGWIRRSCICRAFPPPCRRRCRCRCSTPCRGWSRRR